MGARHRDTRSDTNGDRGTFNNAPTDLSTDRRLNIAAHGDASAEPSTDRDPDIGAHGSPRTDLSTDRDPDIDAHGDARTHPSTDRGPNIDAHSGTSSGTARPQGWTGAIRPSAPRGRPDHDWWND